MCTSLQKFLCSWQYALQKHNLYSYYSNQQLFKVEIPVFMHEAGVKCVYSSFQVLPYWLSPYWSKFSHVCLCDAHVDQFTVWNKTYY